MSLLRHEPRPYARRLLWLVALCLLVTACGLPGDGQPRVVDSTEVPYNLLDDEVPHGTTPEDLPAPRGVPVVFWLRSDDRLVPAAVQASCADDDEDVVRDVLRTLAGSPTDEQRTSGLASAFPPTVRLRLRLIEGDVAQIELGAVDLVDAERLPLAVGQVVLSVTSAPGVAGVELIVADRAVELPLPGGALADRPVTADDYASLLPDRLLATTDGAPAVDTDLGCPASPA
jgi:hypothetical protein